MSNVNTKQYIKSFLVLVGLLSTLGESHELCSMTQYKEMDKIRDTVLMALPQETMGNVEIQSETCYEEDFILVSMQFEIMLMFRDEVFMLYAQVDKKDLGATFSEDLSYDFSFYFQRPEHDDEESRTVEVDSRELRKKIIDHKAEADYSSEQNERHHKREKVKGPVVNLKQRKEPTALDNLNNTEDLNKRRKNAMSKSHKRKTDKGDFRPSDVPGKVWKRRKIKGPHSHHQSENSYEWSLRTDEMRSQESETMREEMTRRSHFNGRPNSALVQKKRISKNVKFSESSENSSGTVYVNESPNQEENSYQPIDIRTIRNKDLGSPVTKRRKVKFRLLAQKKKKISIMTINVKAKGKGWKLTNKGKKKKKKDDSKSEEKEQNSVKEDKKEEKRSPKKSFLKHQNEKYSNKIQTKVVKELDLESEEIPDQILNAFAKSVNISNEEVGAQLKTNEEIQQIDSSREDDFFTLIDEFTIYLESGLRQAINRKNLLTTGVSLLLNAKTPYADYMEHGRPNIMDTLIAKRHRDKAGHQEFEEFFQNNFDPRTELLMKRLPVVRDEVSEFPVGYSLSFDFLLDDMKTFKMSEGFMFKFSLSALSTGDSKDELEDKVASLVPGIKRENISFHQDIKRNGAIGMSFNVVDPEALDPVKLDYFMIFNNNQFSPNNNNLARESRSSIFEVWLIMRQEPGRTPFLMEEKDKNISSEKFVDNFSMEGLLKNFLGQVFEMGSLKVISKKQQIKQISAELAPLEYLDLRTPKGEAKWVKLEGLSLAMPQIIGTQNKRSHLIRLDLSPNRIAKLASSWISGGELTAEAKSEVQRLAKLAREIMCKVTFFKEMDFEHGRIWKGHDRQEQIEELERAVTGIHITRTGMKVTCKNMSDDPDPKFRNENDVLKKNFGFIRKNNLKRDTYASSQKMTHKMI